MLIVEPWNKGQPTEAEGPKVLSRGSESPRGDTAAISGTVWGRECGEETPWLLPFHSSILPPSQSFPMAEPRWRPTDSGTWTAQPSVSSLSNTREGQEKDLRANRQIYHHDVQDIPVGLSAESYSHKNKESKKRHWAWSLESSSNCGSKVKETLGK